MKTSVATTLLLAGALLIPAAGYAGEMSKDRPSKVEKATEKVKEGVEDAAITTKIKADYAKDKQVSAMKIHVETDKGVVKLTGNAKSTEEADKAVSIAKNTKGVVSVTNEIQVASAGKK